MWKKRTVTKTQWPWPTLTFKEIEDVFVKLLVEMSIFKWPLTINKGLNLVNTLIQGTKYKQAVIEFQEKFCHGMMKEESTKGKVSKAYWLKFMD